jgi:hypothetical protein
MRRGLAVRRLPAAWWSRLIGAITLPVVALAALGSRIGLVPSEAVLPLIVAAFVLALLAVGLAAVALAEIWKSGGEGAGDAVAGVAYALPVLLLLALIVGASLHYPRLTEISTDPGGALAFANPGAPEVTPDEQQIALQAQAYPDIAPRFYPLPIAEVHAAARDVLDDRGWELTREVPPPSMPFAAAPASPIAPTDPEVEVKPYRGKRVVTQSRSEATRPASAPIVMEPTAPEPPAIEAALLQATARTLLFQFADEVIVRLEETPDGTRVDMRSASRIGAHDLGQNARRIRRFFADLDLALQPKPDAPAPAAPVAPAEPESAAAAPPELPVSQ